MVWIWLKDVYVLLGEIQETCFLAKTAVILFFPIFIYEQWLVITASWKDLEAVIFV